MRSKINKIEKFFLNQEYLTYPSSSYKLKGIKEV